MTIKRAEKITGLSILIEKQGRFWDHSLVDQGVKIISVLKVRHGDPDGLDQLVKINYRRVCRLVDERARYRCEECGAIGKPMGHHHVLFRARGQRVDTLFNLKLCCSDCHDKAHGRKHA